MTCGVRNHRNVCFGFSEVKENALKQLDYSFKPPSYSDDGGDKSDSKKSFSEICAENGF